MEKEVIIKSLEFVLTLFALAIVFRFAAFVADKKRKNQNTKRAKAKIVSILGDLNAYNTFSKLPFLFVEFEVDGEMVKANTDRITYPKRRDLPSVGSEIDVEWCRDKKGNIKCRIADEKIDTYSGKEKYKMFEFGFLLMAIGSFGMLALICALCMQ